MCQIIEIIKSELISIGKVESIDDKSSLICFCPYGSSEAYRIYDMLDIDALADKDLILLFKGLVIAEKELSWKCGATTPASRIYDEICRLGLDTDYALADWAFQYSDNEYIPFGFIRHGEKNAYEYLKWREDFNLRIFQERADAETRKEERLKRAKDIAMQKKRLDTIDSERYNKIMQLEPFEQVQTIVNDDLHILLYYMPVINELLKRTDVPNQCWRTLFGAVSLLKDTPFNRRLKKVISKRINDEPKI